MNLDNGGLQRLFAMILAGIAAQSPRMVSASVMALARLTFEFASELQVIVAQLLPPICALLRSKAREVIRAVLGFLKVVAMRVPAELVQPHLKLILGGILLWAEDSKNKFKLKVRRLIERLAKRCGFEAVAAVWPESDEKLLAAIRKGFARKARQKAVRDGDTEGSEGGVSGAKTARASEWGHTAIFSDDDEGFQEDGDARSLAGRSRMSTQSRTSKAAKRGAGMPLEPRAAVRLSFYFF
jgi:ribosomal RNA-processing protein 12